MRNFVKELKTSILITGLFGVMLCGLYPLAVFAVSQGLFPDKANGSLLYHNANIVGSGLLAQSFTGPQYFHPRPSAAGDGYDAVSSGGSNLGPTSKKLIETVQERVKQYRAENDLPDTIPVPADAVTASGSGLDPHISVKNALLQVSRVAKARDLSEETVRDRIRVYTEGRDLGILGEARINVLQLNLTLDRNRGRS